MAKIDILKQVSSPAIGKYKSSIMGNSIYAILDNDRRIEIRFNDPIVKDQYDCIEFTLYSKTNGKLQFKRVSFSSIFHNEYDQRNLAKYIWDSYGRCDWYGKPTIDDLNHITDTIKQYIDLWI